MIEEWVYIEGSKDYFVSNLGRVRSSDVLQWNELCQCYSTHKGRILSPTSSFGYLYVQIYNKDGTCKRCRVHKLVAEAFIPNPFGLKYINHIDGDKTNNCVDNLEWCTNSENVQHAYDTNLINIDLFKSVNSSQAKPHALFIPEQGWLYFGSKKEMQAYLGVSKVVFKSLWYQKYLREEGILYKEIGKDEYFALKSSTTIPSEV